MLNRNDPAAIRVAGDEPDLPTPGSVPSGGIKTKRLIAGLVVLALTGFGAAASAQDSGFFIGGFVGSTNFDGGGADDSDTSYGISAGFEFNENFAIAAGYDDFGSISEAGTTLDADGYNIRLIGTVPLDDKWSLFGQIGNQHWDARVSSGGTSISIDDDDLLLGIGGQLELGKTLSLLGGYNYFEADNVDISTWYFGGQFSFR